MEDIFITDIRIDHVRHLRNIDIPLSKTARKHLILTGKNGSGKTSVLDEAAKLAGYLSYTNNRLDREANGLMIDFNRPSSVVSDAVRHGDFVIASYKDRRHFNPAVPRHVE